MRKPLKGGGLSSARIPQHQIVTVVGEQVPLVPLLIVASVNKPKTPGLRVQLKSNGRGLGLFATAHAKELNTTAPISYLDQMPANLLVCRRCGAGRRSSWR